MIDDKYLRILAAVYCLSNENPNRPTFLSNDVAALLGVDADGLLVLLRYLVSRGLLDGDPLEIYAMPVALTAAGTDYIESPLDALRTVEKSLVQTSTINVGGNLNVIDSKIVQMNAGAISESDANITRDSFDTIVGQLPPDIAASQDTQKNRDSLNAKLQAGDRLGAAGVISSLAKVVITVAKDAAALIQAIPIIYHVIQRLFNLP
jgi:hypothetical protein